MAPIGYPNELKDHNNEAYNNYQLGFHTQFENLYEDVGIESVGLEDGLLIYPNPSNEAFTVENKKGTKIGSLQVYDLQGKLVLEKEIETHSTTINLKKVERGVYLLVCSGKSLD